MALGLYLSNARNDPDYQKAGSLLVSLRASVLALSEQLSPAERDAAESYANELVDVLAKNLRSLTGEGGQPH